jgi:predicted N-acyltransferase
LGSRAYTVEVVNRIDGVDAKEWDALCQARPTVSHRWLRLTEAAIADPQPRYLQLRQGGQLVAAAVCSLPRRARLPPWGPNGVSRALARRLPARFRPLRCEIPISFEAGLLTRRDCDASHLIPPLLKAIGCLARRERTLFIRAGYLSAEDESWPGLRAAGYHRVHVLPEAYLEISRPTIEAYQASLPSRKRRELRRYLRRAKEAGVSVETICPSPDNEPLLRELVHNVFSRHRQHDFYAPDLFSRAKAVLGDDFTLLEARRDGQVVACIALLRNKDVLLPRFMGLDYRRTIGTFTYHALLAESVSKAIELGVRSVRFGPTVYEIKRDLGALLHDRFTAIATGDRLLNTFLGVGLGLTGKLSAQSPA